MLGNVTHHYRLSRFLTSALLVSPSALSPKKGYKRDSRIRVVSDQNRHDHSKEFIYAEGVGNRQP